MRSAAAILVSFCVAGPLAAQSTEAMLRDRSAAEVPSGRMSEDDRGRITASRFAECLVKRKPTWVGKLLQVPNEKSNAMIVRADMSDCLASGQLRFHPSLLRGALFQAKYRVDYGRADTPLNVTQEARTFYAADFDSNPGYYTTLAVADCVVRKDAAAARKVVTTYAGTQQNNEAYKALVPVLSDCVTPGVTMKFSKAIVDGFLAEALYRRTAASGPAASKDH